MTRLELLVILVAVLGIGFVVVQPYYEAKAFNKFSSTKATYWYGVFAYLKVIPK